MKGDKKVIGHLNTVLKNELTAINQYFLHSRMLDNWGVHKMARHEYKESIEEMQHADKVIQRVLMLDGLPNLQDLGKLMIGENVKEVIECDLKLEIVAVADLRAGIRDCETAQDYVTRDLFIAILRDEENHIDHLETQLQMIKDQGLENFIQLQSEAELPNHA
jgi:bacterioferritin